MNKKICPNCGADIFDQEAECPFCGYINLTGAEEKFMRDIQKTEEDLNQIPQMQKSEYKQSFFKNTKLIVITISIAVFLAAVLFGIHMLFEYVVFSYKEPDPKARMLWERENFAVLDDMYEAGDFEGIRDFELAMYEENDKTDVSYSISNWEHYGFYRVYCDYSDFEEYIRILNQGEELSKFQAENIVYYGVYFYKRKYADLYYKLSDEELLKADEYRDHVLGYMFERFGFTTQELDELYDKAGKKGYEDFDVYYDYGVKIKDRFK